MLGDDGGEEGGDTSISFPRARIRVTYVPFSYTPWEDAREGETGKDGHTLRIEQSVVSAEFLQMPDGHFRWVGDGEKIEERPGVIFPSIEFEVIEPLVPNLELNVLSLLVGSVNKEVFIRFPINTVLYMGAATRRMIGLLELNPSVIVHKFRQRKESWQKAFRAGEGWQAVYGGSLADPKPPYEEIDMWSVIQTAVPQPPP